MTHRQVPEGVGRTGIVLAAVRAEESRRPDRLFDDPYAEAFVAAAPEAIAEERPAKRASGPAARCGAALDIQIVLRTRFYDDYLLAACAAGCRQVVLLAAGLDSRAFRLAWPHGVRLYELGLPEVLSFKQHVLDSQHAAPRCERVALAVDLRADWPAELTGAGFQLSAPTGWLAEGLLIYLSTAEVARLLTAVDRLSAPGSQLSFGYRTPEQMRSLLSRARQAPGVAPVASLWKGGIAEDAPDWLSRHGWRTRLYDYAALAASYGRPITAISSGSFLVAVRLSPPA